MSNSEYEVPSVKIDGVVKSVLEKYVGRAIVGKEKYGKTMDRTDLNKTEWLTHLQEELMDATLYIEKLKRMEEKLCVVFVTNQKYLEKFYATCSQLRSVGNYKGDVCLIIGDDLNNSEFRENEFITKNNIIVKHYPDTQFTPEFLEKQKQLMNPFGLKNFFNTINYICLLIISKIGIIFFTWTAESQFLMT